MESISLRQDFSYNPTFSFESALGSYSYDFDHHTKSGPHLDFAVLYSHGCLVNNTLNCTAACQDPSLIFASPYTMRNCMILASLGPTKANANGSLIRRNRTLNPDSMPVLTNFSIHLRDPQFSTLASDVNTTISDCLQQYCDRNDVNCLGDFYCSSFDDGELDGYFESPNNPTGYCYPDICFRIGPSHVNPDIFGIGVCISYWMQTGIAIFLFFLLKICDALLYYTWPFFYTILLPWVCTVELKIFKETFHKAQASLHRYQPAIKSATIEFHKAQCFFMIAIGIAGQIVLRQRSLEDGSLESLVNYTLVGIISVNGVLPVTLTLLCLHTVRIHSRYMLVLSTWTVALSTVTFFMSVNFPLSAQRVVEIAAATNTNYSLCGNKDPSIFCANEKYLASGTGVRPVAFSLVILGFVILDYCGFQEVPMVQRFFKWFFGQIKSLIEPKPGTEHRHSRLQRARGARGENTAQDYLHGVSNALYLFIWIYYAVNFHIFLSGLRSLSPVGGWTFGQVVAITVWVAPIIELVKLLVQGLKAGLDYRIPFPYKIIDSKNPEDEPETDTEETGFKWTHPFKRNRHALKRKLEKHIIPSGTQPEEVFKIF